MAIIDGVNGNHSERLDEKRQIFSDEDLRLYKRLKEIYNGDDNELKEELCHDLARREYE